jgi:hypothetical protein
MLHMASKKRRTAVGTKAPVPQPLAYSENALDNGVFLEKLVTRLIRKDTIPPPRVFIRGNKIEEHLQAIEKYLKAMEVEDMPGKSAILLNSLEDSVILEVKAQPGATKHEDDFYWLCNCLQMLYKSLFNIKQKSDQNIHDYLNELRVEAYKNMHFVDEERKEEFLLAAFIKGIRDRQVAEALEVLKPATISDAMKLVKSEMKRQQENESQRPEFVRATFEKHFNEENSQVKELTAQVRQMQLHLNHILAFIQRLENTKDNSLPIKVHQITPVLGNFMKNNIGNSHNRPSGGNYRQNLRKPIRPIICFNCNKEGHIARQCRQSSQIQRGTFKNVRQLHEDVHEVPSYCTDKQDDDLESKVSSENNCYAMNLVKMRK